MAGSLKREIEFCQGRKTMKPSSKDEAIGKIHEVKGNVKEKIGRLTNNPELEGEGIGEKVAGKIRKKIGQIEKVMEKP